MAYDEGLAERVRDLLVVREAFSERKMFGGICFMLGGHMAGGVIGDELIVRLTPEDVEKALTEDHTRLFDPKRLGRGPALASRRPALPAVPRPSSGFSRRG
ncbi:MAG: TfoX/Sxy family protein [Solirubrobacterales bacterium]